MLFCDSAPQLVQIDILLRLAIISLRFVVLDQRICYIGAGSHVSLVLRRELDILWKLVLRHGHRLRRHGVGRARNGKTSQVKREPQKRRKDAPATSTLLSTAVSWSLSWVS